MDAMASAELLWLSYSMYPHPRCLLGTLSGASSTFLILPKASNTLQRREGIRDTARGGRVLNRDTARGGRALNRDTAKGGRALTTNYRQGRDGRISYKVELHDRVKILKATYVCSVY